MLGLATVMYALLLTVTRHGLLLTQPCVTRLGLALSMSTVRGGGGLNVYASIPPFQPAPDCFLTVGHHSCLRIVSQLPFGPCQFPCISWRSVVSFSVGHFLPPFQRGSYPGSDLVPHSSSTPIIFGLFARLGVISSPRISWHLFCGAWRLGARPVVLGPA